MNTEDRRKIFERSRWIWPESHNWDLYNSYAVFRKSFAVSKIPAKAPLFITADQSYQLYVNGKYICRGPARGFQRSWPYDEVDVRRHLQRGTNTLAIRAHNPGFSNFQYLSQGYAGLLVAAQWGNVAIHSDKTWKCRRQSGVHRDTVPTSLQLFCQEHIDLRAEDPGWMAPEFDDTSWTGLVAEHPWNGMPWSSLEPRGIPMLEETVVLPSECLGESSARCARQYRTTRDIARLRFTEGLGHKPCSSDIGSIRVEPSGSGRFRSFLIDFGKTVVGSIGFHISDAVGGEIIDTLHTETIDSRTLSPHFVPDQGCRMAFGHRLICRPGRQTHTFYHAFGFRYAIITVRDSRSTMAISPFLRTTLYPLEKKGGFRSSDGELNRIWDACAWTERVCSLDAFVDTPWREQAQWWGDARVQAKNTFFLSGDTRLFRRGIQQIGMETTPDGVTYGHAPTMAHNCVLPDFTLIWMLTLWDFYWQTGSLEPFVANQGPIARALKYFGEHLDPKSGLVGYDERYWLFLDWTGLFKDGYSAVYNLWLLIALEKLAQLHRLAGSIRDSESLSGRAKKLRSAISKLVRKDGLIADGMTFDGQQVDSASIHAQTLAVMAAVRPDNHTTQFQNVLLPFIRGELVPEVSPSSYWITYVFEVLTDAGFGAEVVEFIRRKWKPMADFGTTWENFSPRPGEWSFSHAWSAHPLYHLMQTVGGIRQSQVGWKEIIFRPVFYSNYSRSTVPTPLGEIRSFWERKDRELVVELNLPEGMSARIILPNTKIEQIRGHKKWKIPSEAILDARGHSRPVRASAASPV